MELAEWSGREGVARYIDRLAGGTASEVSNASIAQHVNERVHGAKFAGALIGRWRRGEVDISPGNLAALSRAYDRNPVEAFLLANMLSFEEARGALDIDSLRLLADVRESMEDLYAETQAKEWRSLADGLQLMARDPDPNDPEEVTDYLLLEVGEDDEFYRRRADRLSRAGVDRRKDMQQVDDVAAWADDEDER